MITNYSRAYTEILEFLNHLPKDEYSKIPKEQIAFYMENMDKNYNFSINPTINLAKQNLSREANAIIVLLFRDYFASDSQREKLKILLNKNEIKSEKEKSLKYNPNNIFKTNLDKENIKNQGIIIYKENIFLKILNKIKLFFTKQK